ncbi:hypothetical protein ZOSMA_54G00790 [Zostera marina]|uniref:Trichome birefringence-like C-terminal domain-containing protein n=1 Tax=Zostera marina TaxID=29655 RepID=A0A0K9NWY0_ZOSMR|nr:hypothetical protein ZOSMA_54G00790 [Zostera marina]
MYFNVYLLTVQVDYPIDISNSTDVDFKQVFYVKYNFTITVMWSHFLVRTVTPPNNDLNGIWKMYLDEPDDSWFPDIAKFDYVVISDGNWFMKQSMYYEKGKLIGCSKCHIEGVEDLTMYYGNKKAFRTALAALNNLKEFKGMVFLRTISPDHFQNGDWATGGDCPKTMPYGRNQIDLYESGVLLYQGQLEEFIQAEKIGRFSKGLKYGLIDITQAMLLRPDGHPNKYGHQRQPNQKFRNDCVHWCLPGPIELWNEFMYQLMIQLA